MFLPNCPQFAIAFFGILRAGCVHVPVNPLFREHELLYEPRSRMKCTCLPSIGALDCGKRFSPASARRQS